MTQYVIVRQDEGTTLFVVPVPKFQDVGYVREIAESAGWTVVDVATSLSLASLRIEAQGRYVRDPHEPDDGHYLSGHARND